MEIKEKFFSKARLTPACWIWSGSFDKDKYGCFMHNGKMLKAHRVSWEIHNGPILPKMCICHKCDIPSCVNPQHLFMGTQKQNVEDCLNKKRHKNPVYRGEKHPCAKLNWEQVNEIRRDLFISQNSFAVKFGVSQTLVGLIRRNILWKVG